MNTYRNPWHRSGKAEYGPAFYETDVTPTIYRGYQIFHRQQQVWDVVLNGLCITQMAGINGAKRAIDQLVDVQVPA